MANPVGRPPFPVRGAPPDRPVVGTEQPPAHAVPGERLDPRNFVGPLEQPGVEAPPGLGTPPRVVLEAERGIADPLGRLPVDGRLTAFLARLPASGLLTWHRKLSRSGASAIVAGTTVRSTVTTVTAGYALILMLVRQLWLDSGGDPADASVLTALQDNQDAYGRVGFNLLINNVPIWDAQETLYDPLIVSTRTLNGFTLLNTNLLNVGEHPTAIYARENSAVQAAWETSTIPVHIPTVVMVELQGYLVAMREFSELMVMLRGGVR